MQRFLSANKLLRTGVASTVKRSVGLGYRRQIQNAWSVDTDSFWHMQNGLFRDMYFTAVSRVPYYRERADEYPEISSSQSLLDSLRQLPILEKATLKRHNEAFWMTPPTRFTTFHTTSGTSGTPLRIPANLFERSKADAILADWYRRIAGNPSPRILALSGFLSPEPGATDLFWEDKLGGRLFLSIYALNEANRAEIASAIDAFRPELIYGYASAVHQLALLFVDQPLLLRDELVAVVTSEILQPHWRQDIERSLVRMVFDFYGSQEGAHLALQCEHGAFHIHPLVGVIEIVDSRGEAVRAGDSGRVLVTSLLRKSFPLIRYEVGDVAVSTGYYNLCACGIKWPTIGQIEGRSEDLVLTRDGRKIGYLCFHATKDLPGIQEAQLRQTGYETFHFMIVPMERGSFDKSLVEQSIIANLEKRIQAPVSVSFQYPESIRRGPNGKFKAVVVDFSG